MVEAITFFHFISCIPFLQNFLFLNDFCFFVEFLILFLYCSWVHWFICVLLYITQLLSNHYFEYFFRKLADLHFLGVSCCNTVALLWCCHVSLLFHVSDGLCWYLCIWGWSHLYQFFQTGSSKESPLPGCGCGLLYWVGCSVFGSWESTVMESPCHSIGWNWNWPVCGHLYWQML